MRRREAVVHVRRQLGTSERRTCRGLDLAAQYSTVPRKRKADEGALLRAIEALACQHPRTDIAWFMRCWWRMDSRWVVTASICGGSMATKC